MRRLAALLLPALFCFPTRLFADPLISEFMASNASVHADDFGEYSDWIEIYNPTDQAIDLQGYYLTDDKKTLTKWQFPEALLNPFSFLVVYASGTSRRADQPDPMELKRDQLRHAGFTDDWVAALSPEQLERVLRQLQNPALRGLRNVPGVPPQPTALHTDFKLDADGEYLALVKPDGTTICHAFKPKFPDQETDISYGIPEAGKPDLPPDQEAYAALLKATPGAPNSEALLGIIEPMAFSRPRGTFEEPFFLSLSSSTEDVVIRYTTNGDVPTPETGHLYEGPIPIEYSQVIRAAAFKPGHRTTSIATHTYLRLRDVVHQSPRGEAPPGWPRGFVNGQRLDYGMNPDIVTKLHTEEETVQALASLPALSIVTSIENLFDPSTGIYVNAGMKGREWERVASLEILPNGEEIDAFQIDGGLRIRGGFSRQGNNPKHCLRMIFRKEYGAGKLKYPLFGDEGADEFDKIDFRSSMNYSWAFSGGAQNTLLRDVYSRDLQRDMGQPYTRSRFYHLYLNGQYWGIYMTQERAEASYGATYFGGEKEDYDVIKTFGEVVDGNGEARQRLYVMARKGFRDDADYFRAQGLNPDGSRNPDYERLLDVDNLIDYMLITFYTGDKDGPGGTFAPGNNYYMIYNRENPDGFKHFEHDSEHSMDTGNVDMTGSFIDDGRGSDFNSHWLHTRLVENKHYLKRFTERVEKHFFEGGPLTPEASLARLEVRENTIKQAIIAHAARWGDSTGSPGYTDRHWMSAVQRIKDWIATRNEVVLRQFHDRGWYHGLPTPRLNRRQGEVPDDFKLFVIQADGEAWFTTDGSDPKGADGRPSPAAKRAGIPRLKTVKILASPSEGKALVPIDGRFDDRWYQPDFDDSGWMTGHTGIGYEARSGYEQLIGLDLRQLMHNQNTTAYLRIPFEVGDPSAYNFDEFHLKMRYDDGFIAYLNGRRIAAENAPEDPRWNSTASADHSDDQAVEFVPIPLGSARDLLKPGRNLLAIHGMDGEASSDFLITPELEGLEYLDADPIPLTGAVTVVKVRAFEDEKWSPPLVGVFRKEMKR